MNIDLTCFHCGGRSFHLVIDEYGDTMVVCENHDAHVEELRGDEAGGETGP